jgi:hypothetical protein
MDNKITLSDKNYLVLKILNENELSEYEFNNDLEYLMKKWFGSINGFYDLCSLSHLQESFKKGIYHFDLSKSDYKETTIILNFKKFLNEEVPNHYFPFRTSPILIQLLRELKLSQILN